MGGGKAKSAFQIDHAKQSSHQRPSLIAIRHLTRDLEFLAASTHITELSYSVSDIQARIFGTCGAPGSHTSPYPINLPLFFRFVQRSKSFATSPKVHRTRRAPTKRSISCSSVWMNGWTRFQKESRLSRKPLDQLSTGLRFLPEVQAVRWL